MKNIFPTIHGKSRDRVYKIWAKMKNRCLNPNSDNYPNYGGRGITCDPSWFDFNSFLVDMGDPPKGCELDRIDNNKGYTKDNCEWVFHIENSQHRRSSKLTADDVSVIKTLLQYYPHSYGKSKFIRIAELFNVTDRHISDINNGARWGNVGALPV